MASSIVFDVSDRALWNTASALAIFLMHLLGDIPSPVIAGAISDATNIFTAFSLMPIPMVLASFFFYKASGYLSNKPTV